jgi:hypothetical protein
MSHRHSANLPWKQLHLPQVVQRRDPTGFRLGPLE